MRETDGVYRRPSLRASFILRGTFAPKFNAEQHPFDRTMAPTFQSFAKNIPPPDSCPPLMEARHPEKTEPLSYCKMHYDPVYGSSEVNHAAASATQRTSAVHQIAGR